MNPFRNTDQNHLSEYNIHEKKKPPRSYAKKHENEDFKLVQLSRNLEKKASSHLMDSILK